MALTITDQDGIESDELSITVADPRADIPWPRHGVSLSVSLGYAHTGAQDMGVFVVDTVELSHPPRQWEIRAKAVDFGSGKLKVRRSRAWESTTLGAVVSDIAKANGLTGKTSAELASKAIARLDQTTESDLSLLTRLSRQFDAIATVKAGTLLFAQRGQGAAVSGAALPETTIMQTECSEWRVSIADQDTYTAVEARFYDRNSAEEIWTRAGSGEGDQVFRLRRTYPDRASAQAAAEAKLGALGRGSALLSLSMPGRPSMACESPIVLEGFGDGVDGRWIATAATHRLDDSGYVVEVDAEKSD
jgi:phage protein D